MKSNQKKNVKTGAVLKSDKQQNSYYDFMAILFIVAYLVIDFLPYFDRAEIIKPQFLYLNCLNIITAIFIYFNRTEYSCTIISALKKSYPFKAYFLFVTICSLSIFWARNSSLAITGATEILIVLVMILNFVVLLYNRLHLIYKIAFIVSLCAFFQTFPVLLKLKSITDPEIIKGFIYGESIKGNTGNINIFAASVMIKLPFILIALYHFKHWKKLFLGLVLFICLSMIFFISARTALLSLVFVLITHSFYLYQVNENKKHLIKQMAYVFMPLIIAYGFTNFVFKNLKTNDSRYASSVGRLAEVNTKDHAAQARLAYWGNSIKLAKAHPFLGVGFGNYRVESIPYEFSNAILLSLHTHNDFLEITAETGFINGAIFFSLFVVLFFINAKRVLKNKGEPHVIATLSLMLFLVYFFDSFFNFPMFRPTMQVGFGFLMVLTLANSQNKQQENSPLSKKMIVFIILLALLPLYVTYYANETSLLENKIKADKINENTKGVLKGDDVVSFEPKFPNVFIGSEAFDEYAGVYYFREKKYKLATAFLDKGNKINPYLGRPDFYKFLMAKEIGNLDSAYAYVKNTIGFRPSTGFYINAIDMATKLKDSLGMFKMYKQAVTINNDPTVFVVTFNALKNINFNSKKLIAFGNEAKIFFKNDTVTKTINNYRVSLKLGEGQALQLQGKFKQALAKYNEALAIDVTNVFALQNIGFYYYDVGEYGQAINYLLRVLNKPDMQDGKTEYALSLCYFKFNDTDNGCKYQLLAYQKKFISSIDNSLCKPN